MFGTDILYVDLKTIIMTLHFVIRLIRKSMHIRQITPFRNPTTNYRIRIPILTFLLLAYGKCSDSHFLTG